MTAVNQPPLLDTKDDKQFLTPERGQARHPRKKSPHSRRSPAQIQKFRELQQIYCECFVCRIPMLSSHMQAGHIESIDRDGSNEVRNLKMVCVACNLAMGVENMYAYRSLYYEIEPPPDIALSEDYKESLESLLITRNKKSTRNLPPKYIAQQVWYKQWGFRQTGECFFCEDPIVFPCNKTAGVARLEGKVGVTCKRCAPNYLVKGILREPVNWKVLWNITESTSLPAPLSSKKWYEKFYSSFKGVINCCTKRCNR